MKLADLRNRLRAPEPKSAVDQLDDFLIAKGTMTPPPGARRPEMRKTKDGLIIIDDPMHDLIGEPSPVDGSKPDSFETMIRRGDYVNVHGATKPRIAGTLVYSPKEDELGQVKCVEPSGIVQIWFGARTESGSEIIKNEHVRDLYVVRVASCPACRGYRGSDRWGGWSPCKKCNGLRNVPTQEGLKPWAEEKARRALERDRR